MPAIKDTSNALPEMAITEGPIVDQTLEAVEVHTKANKLQIQEKRLKEEICNKIQVLQLEEFSKDNVVGLFRVNDDKLPPVRVEMKIKNGALELSDLPVLDGLFGKKRPELFEKATVVSEILDPEVLIKKMTAKGLNPWDYLTVSVKDNMDEIVSKYDGVSVSEAILPKKGFLAKLKEHISTCSQEAKNYLKEYLKQALSPTMVMGKK